MSSGFTCWWTSWLVSVMVSNRWKEGGMTVGHSMPCTSESFSKKPKQNPAEHCNRDHVLPVWHWCKGSVACVCLLPSQAIHSLRKGTWIVLPATMPNSSHSKFEWNYHAPYHLHYSITSCDCQQLQGLSRSSRVLLLPFGTKSELGVHFSKSLIRECQI